MVAGQAAAFMSYARFDDAHDDGQLTAFRDRLAAEVRAQTGEKFPIFQDRADIAWGQNWQRRIEERLDGVTLLLVIITPGFFRSTACRQELERFAARERELGRDDLILPVYYISAPEIDDPARRDSDPLAGLLASRQLADWRELRFEPLTTPVARRAMARLAARMRDASWLPAISPKALSGARKPQAPAAPQDPAVAQDSGTGPAGAGRVTARSEPSAQVADADKRSDFGGIVEVAIGYGRLAGDVPGRGGAVAGRGGVGGRKPGCRRAAGGAGAVPADAAGFGVAARQVLTEAERGGPGDGPGPVRRAAGRG